MKNDLHTKLAFLKCLVSALALAIFLVCCMGVYTTGCASSPARQKAVPRSFPIALKMQHQIMFHQGNDVYVFDGYFVLAKDGFLIKAFAGPGIELFTVTRRGKKQSAKLHIPSLEDRIDLESVGADIARVYLGGCPMQPDKREVSCDSEGEPLVELRDQSGKLIERRYPEAHGIGLRVRYEDYRSAAGSSLPHKITLSWNGSKNSMVILVVACENFDERNGNTLDRLTEIPL